MVILRPSQNVLPLLVMAGFKGAGNTFREHWQLSGIRWEISKGRRWFRPFARLCLFIFCGRNPAAGSLCATAHWTGPHGLCGVDETLGLIPQGIQPAGTLDPLAGLRLLGGLAHHLQNILLRFKVASPASGGFPPDC